MTFPAYPNYKPSGVEWLGNVPEHWEVKRLKYALSLVTEKADGSDNPVALENIESWSGRFIPTETDFAGEGIAFKCGDILFGKLRPYLAKVYRAESAGEAVGDFYVLRPSLETDSLFSQYQILNREFISIVDGSTFGSKMPRASWDFIGGMRLAFPPLPEQKQIAAFLDQETAKIDELVAEQRRLLELLKEKRQAVISHAVTRGLDPKVPLKPSGIDWLGDVPEHWQVTKLKAIATFSGGGTPSRDNLDFWNGNIPWVSPKDMKRERITRAEESITEEGLRNSTTNLIPAGRVLMVVRSGILQHTIPVAINEIPVALNQDMKVFNFDSRKCIPDFFIRWVQGHNVQLLLAWAKQGATVESIEHAYLVNTSIPLPSVSEQTKIIRYLDTEIARFDTLTAEAERAIALLQERRTALISAAVTGQIDVVESEQKASHTERAANVHFKRAVFAAEIISRMHQDPTFGHVKFEKLMFLAENLCGVDLGSNYHRDAAGPFDNKALRSIDSQIEKQKWFRCKRVDKRYYYYPLGNSEGYRPYFAKHFHNCEERLDQLCRFFRTAETEQCEIVATLYSAWKDLLKNGIPSDEEIITEVLEKWHPSKKRIARERWQSAIVWMKGKQMCPTVDMSV